MPTVSGAGTPPRVGDVLTATGGTIANGTHGGWAWLRDDLAISGATSASYTLVEADIDALVYARQQASGAGGSGTAQSGAIGPVEAAEATEPEAEPDAFTAGFTLSHFPSHDEKRIFQRSSVTGGGQGKGRGSIAVPLSGTVTAGSIGARIRSADDGTTILQGPWTGAEVSDDASEAVITNVDARLGWFYVDLQGADETWQLGTVKVGMGALTVFAGQSLMVRMLGRQGNDPGSFASVGITPDANSSTLATYEDAAAYTPTLATMPWLTPGDRTNGTGPNALGVGEYLNRMIALTGVNCGVVGHAVGGANIGSFYTGQSNQVKLSGVMARAGNAFEGFIWGQGHAESRNGIPPNAYAQALSVIFGQMDAANSFAGYAKYVWTIPSMGIENKWGTPWQATQIRKGAELWCAANGGVHVHMDDTPLTSDGIHQGQAGSLLMARSLYRAARARYGASSGLGPRPLSASRSGTLITLTISDEGQSNLVLAGTAGNRLFVYPRGRVSPMGLNATDNRFPVSSVSVVNATTLAITLANDPGAGHELDLWVNWPSGPADASIDTIRDDRVDGDGIATGRLLRANLSAIQIAAPTPAGAVNTPPGGFVAAVSPFRMTETTTTYGASDGGAAFSQQMTGGRAQAIRTPLFVPVTVEGFFTCPPLPASGTQVFFGNFGPTASCFVGLDASGKIRSWTSSATSTTVLVPGKRYHVACQAGPGGIALYLTNVTDGGAGTREYLAAYSGTVVLASGTFSLRAHGSSFVLSGGAVDEWAVFNAERYSGTTYSAPTAPYTGHEADIVALYRCNGDGKDEVAK